MITGTGIRNVGNSSQRPPMLLMYKTAVYRLVNGGIAAIAHQKQHISEKGDDAAIHRPSVNVGLLPRDITFFGYLLFLMCNTAVK